MGLLSKGECMKNKKDRYWMDTASAVAVNSTCTSTLSVGAVLVDTEGVPITLAVNGTADNFPTCDEFGCNFENGKPRHIHAEEQVIINCARGRTKSTEGATLYVTHSPCSRCALRIAQAGITRVVFDVITEDMSLVQRLFRHFNIDFERIQDEQN